MRRPFRVVVSGRSMLPTLSPGDRLLAVRVTRFRRGDVWVFRHRGVLLVKRIAALPGDRVFLGEGMKAVVTAIRAPVAERPGPQPDGSWLLGPDEYLMRGDNRRESTDLRAFGPLGADSLVGRVVVRYWPRPARVR
ncbi:MAG TPA: signal peptidase I [Actinomycetota bacterium]|nr:signal peptidase I [Actinomycetota bacterium]